MIYAIAFQKYFSVDIHLKYLFTSRESAAYENDKECKKRFLAVQTGIAGKEKTSPTF